MKIVLEEFSKHSYICTYHVDDGDRDSMYEPSIIVINVSDENAAINAVYRYLRQYVGDYTRNSVKVKKEINYKQYKKDKPYSNVTVITDNGKVLKESNNIHKIRIYYYGEKDGSVIMNIDLSKYRTPFHFQIESLVDDLESKLSAELKDDIVIDQIDEYVPYSDSEAGMSDRDGEMVWKTIFPRGKRY